MAENGQTEVSETQLDILADDSAAEEQHSERKAFETDYYSLVAAARNLLSNHRSRVQFPRSDSKEDTKRKSERRRSKPEESTQNEIKKFKENLLQTVQAGDSILSESGADMAIPSRSRSASRARDALTIPAKVLAEIDESKLFELKEAFLLFDMDGNGCIDHNDLRGTLVSLGEKVDEQAINSMLAEAPNPLDFDGFVNLLGYQTLELDTEETLIAALSRWDKDNSGYISEARIRHDLMTWGDRFTEKETDYALDEAPTIQKDGHTMIDYVRFCNQLCGLRKAKK